MNFYEEPKNPSGDPYQEKKNGDSNRLMIDNNSSSPQ